jgi:undecaprenyl-diphosphatase
MDWRRLCGFVARRLSPEEYLSLHLTASLVLCLALLGLFVVIARSMEEGKRLTKFDETVGLRLQAHREASPGTRQLFLGITQFGSVPVMAMLAIAGATWLLILRRRLLAFAWLFLPTGAAMLDAGLKQWFERDRPPFHDPSLHLSTQSFPSGHSMGSLVGYGFLAYVIVLFVPWRGLRLLAVVGLAVLILAIGFSRVYLGAHYLSDVLGGFTIGGCWLAASITGLEALRRRSSQRAAGAGTEGSSGSLEEDL